MELFDIRMVDLNPLKMKVLACLIIYSKERKYNFQIKPSLRKIVRKKDGRYLNSFLVYMDGRLTVSLDTGMRTGTSFYK